MNFFQNQELENYKKVAGKKYRKANPNDLEHASLIKPNVEKLNFWAEKSLIEDFTAKLDRSWQWSGTFKSYLWIRFYRPNDSQKVYFVFGINKSGDLYLELNCQRSNHTKGTTTSLSQGKIEAFDKYLHQSNYRYGEVKNKNIHLYNWNKLIEYSKNFLYQYATLYDELEALVNEDQSVENNVDLYVLTESEVPKRMKSYVDRNKSFKGREIDWSKKQLVSSRLGLLGEKLVIKTEKEKVRRLGFPEKVEKIQKRLDGEGYDILSFDKNGEEIFIEVKTTKGNSEEPFYLSANEKAFCELNISKYVIYRLYNYSYQNKSAKVYKIKGADIQTLKLRPTNFEVSK